MTKIGEIRSVDPLEESYLDQPKKFDGFSCILTSQNSLYFFGRLVLVSMFRNGKDQSVHQLELSDFGYKTIFPNLGELSAGYPHDI